MPVSCTKLREMADIEDSSCVLSRLMTVVSVLSMATFVPFALAFSLVYFNMNPTADMRSASSGRSAFKHTFTRVAVVLLSVAIDKPGTRVNIICAGLCAYLCGYMLFTAVFRQAFHRLASFALPPHPPPRPSSCD